MTKKGILLQDYARRLFGPLAYVEQHYDGYRLYTECWGIEFEKVLRLLEIGYEVRNIYRDGDSLMLEIAR